ncbi:MAG: PAS domain-containing protein [Spirochaetes bacterium]|nr:PAS domain-containing protein [Spirochaetota bacterium]
MENQNRYLDIINKKENKTDEEYKISASNINDIGLYICGVDFNIVYINQVLKKKYGKINNKKCYEYFYNKKRKCSYCKFDEIKKGKTIQWIWNSQKENKIYEITESPIKNKDGSIQKIKIIHDITENYRFNEKISDMAKFPEENPNPVFRIMKNGKIIYSNTPGKKILKYWGLQIGDYFNSKYIKSFKNIYSSKKIKKIEVLIKSRYFSFVMIPIYNKNYINVYCYDITEQKKLEVEQKNYLKDIKNISYEAEKKAKEMEAAFAAISEPIVIYNKNNLVTNANHAAEKELGFNPIGFTQNDLLKKLKTKSDNGQSLTIKNLASSKAYKFKSIRKGNYHFFDKDNNEKIASVIASPIEINNKIEGVAVVWHDITDIVNKEKKLIKDKSELAKEVEQKIIEINLKSELLDIIFSNTYISVAYLDTDFNFIRVNNAYANEDNKTPDFYPGKNHFDLYPNEENKKIFHSAVKSKKPYFAYAKPFEYAYNPKKGTTFWDWTLQPVLNKKNNVDGLILSLLNVTDRVINDIKIKNATAELELSKRLSSIGKLAATVAHELRNPLAVIESACYNIERKCKNIEKDIEIEKHIINIEKKISEAEQIIINLLAYARIKLPNYEKTNIVNLMNDCIDTSLNRFLNYNIDISKNYSDDKIYNVEIDQNQMKEVIINIIINAIQSFKNEKGRLKISINPIGECIELIIEDNGSGIEKEDVNKIFEPFFTRKSKGTGLGLSISKEIINLHKGTIIINSKKDIGTKVIIILPKKSEKP